MRKPQNKHLQFRTQHTHSTLIDDAEKLKRLRTWKHWRQFGMGFEAAQKRTKLSRATAKKWAAELGFDLEGLA